MIGLRGRRFSELDQYQVGLVAAGLLAVLVIAGLKVATLQEVFLDTQNTADFSHGSGLKVGDAVEVSGMKVGSVGKVELDGTHVRVHFHVRDVDLGDRSRAAIKTHNAVGTRYLAVTPAGRGDVHHIPLERTSVPYDLQAALTDLTRTSEELDVPQLAEALTSVSGAFSSTPEHLHAALDGISRLSETVASRDDALATMLDGAQGVTGVLADRSDQLVALMADGTKLLDELNSRHEMIRSLLRDTTAVSEQITGLVDDNDKQLGPALAEVRRTVKILQGQDEAIGFIIDNISNFTRNLGEAVGGGPFFYGYVPNLVPTQLLPVLPGLIGSPEGGYE